MRLLKNKNVMMAIVTILVMILILLGVTGCNKQVFDFDLTYDKAICNIGGEYKEIKLSKWKDYDGEQLQLKDKEGNTYLVNSVNCALMND